MGRLRKGVHIFNKEVNFVNWLLVVIVIVRMIVSILKMVIVKIVNHKAACKKFAMIKKSFPDASLEEVVKASVLLTSNET